MNHASHSIRRLRVVSAVQLHCSLPGGPVKGIIPISREVCVVGRVCALCKQAPPEPSTRYAYGGEEGRSGEEDCNALPAAIKRPKRRIPRARRPVRVRRPDLSTRKATSRIGDMLGEIVHKAHVEAIGGDILPSLSQCTIRCESPVWCVHVGALSLPSSAPLRGKERQSERASTHTHEA